MLTVAEVVRLLDEAAKTEVSRLRLQGRHVGRLESNLTNRNCFFLIGLFVMIAREFVSSVKLFVTIAVLAANRVLIFYEHRSVV